MYPRHGRHLQSAVYMREELGATFQVFVDDIAAQGCGIDLQNDEVSFSPEEAIRNGQNLMLVRAMDESLTRKPRRLIQAVLRGRVRVLPGCDVIDAAHATPSHRT